MIRKEMRKFYGKEWKKLSRKIRKRINHCQICGKEENKEKGIYLTIHHKDRNPANNSASNLIVLCPECHFREEFLINKGIKHKAQMHLWKK